MKETKASFCIYSFKDKLKPVKKLNFSNKIQILFITGLSKVRAVTEVLKSQLFLMLIFKVFITIRLRKKESS